MFLSQHWVGRERGEEEAVGRTQVEADQLCVHRNFLTRSYPTMKKQNPHTPIMIREASGTAPTLYARFGMLRYMGA